MRRISARSTNETRSCVVRPRVRGSDLTRWGVSRGIHEPGKWQARVVGYNVDMSETIDLRNRLAGSAIGALVRDARTVIGWTQRELARRADTSQATIWRLETDQPGVIDLRMIERVLTALGMRLSLMVDARHLEDRRRQRDPVHARLTTSVARRLERVGWLTRLEVPVGADAPRGWIDLLAFREADRSLLIEETKTDLPDAGGLQRSISFYDRMATGVARDLGWRPARVTVLVVGHDSSTLASRIADNRDLIRRAFPASVPDLDRWLRDADAEPPHGWAFGLADPLSRRRGWLRPAIGDPRRHAPPYRDYADAAARLRASIPYAPGWSPHPDQSSTSRLG